MMGDHSNIEWTDATWNPIVGCSIVSPGCTNCYAMRWAHSGMKPVRHYEGTTKVVNGKPVWTGKVNMSPGHIITKPLTWKKPRCIFVNSMGDLFHEDVPDAWIDKVFAVMALCPQHTFQVLTKRSKRMREYMTALTRDTENWREVEDIRIAKAMGEVIGECTNWQKGDPRVLAALENIDITEGRWPLLNVWLGVSAENQHWLMQRACDLVETPAAIRFLSCEPLLGDLDLTPFIVPPYQWDNGWHNNYPFQFPKHRIDWVIAGGESGSYARPMHPEWVRSIRAQCAGAGVAFFFKQWGEWAYWDESHPWVPSRGCALTNDGRKLTDARAINRTAAATEFCLMQRLGKKRAGRLLDGIEHNGYPRSVLQSPESAAG